MLNSVSLPPSTSWQEKVIPWWVVGLFFFTFLVMEQLVAALAVV